jgi:hypothetical protein
VPPTTSATWSFQALGLRVNPWKRIRDYPRLRGMSLLLRRERLAGVSVRGCQARRNHLFCRDEFGYALDNLRTVEAYGIRFSPPGSGGLAQRSDVHNRACGRLNMLDDSDAQAGYSAIRWLSAFQATSL